MLCYHAVVMNRVRALCAGADMSVPSGHVQKSDITLACKSTGLNSKSMPFSSRVIQLRWA